MPTWGPVLGAKKISEAVAYILSKHTEGEPVEIDPAAAPPPQD
jgi:cytochrome c oxidase cbb3-type subunit 3